MLYGLNCVNLNLSLRLGFWFHLFLGIPKYVHFITKFLVLVLDYKI